MGDRISISFVRGDEESVALFSHWGGEAFAEIAKDYVLALKGEISKLEHPTSEPLYRLEPSTVMADFIRHITIGMPRVTSDIYLGKDEQDGDNGDNGHYRIVLD